MGVDGPAGRHEDAPVDDLTQGFAHDGRRQLGHRREQLVVDPGAGRRRDTEDLLALLRDGRHPGQDDVAQPRRQVAVGRLSGGGEDLLGVERVPAGPRPDPVDEVRGGHLAELVGQQVRQLIAVEPAEVDPVDPVGALQLRDIRADHVSRVQLVGAQGGQDEHPVVAQVSGQERQQVARRRIRPLQILDHEHQGRHRGQPFDDAQHELEQAPLRESVVGAVLGWPRRSTSDRVSTRSGRARTSGMSRASSPRFGPRSAVMAPGSTSRSKVRKASTNGA